jgi:thiamine transport system substrate-binding protein
MRRWLILLCATLALVACAQNPAAPSSTAPSPSDAAPSETPLKVDAPTDTQPLTVMTHDSFAISPETIAAFEARHNAKVTILNSGDSGSMLNKAILSKDAPLADVLYGVDNTFLSRAQEADIFVPYTPTDVAFVEGINPADSAPLIPVDRGYVLINYDVAALQTLGLEPPRSLQDLLMPEYKGLLIVQNPALSSPGLAFLLATVAEFGPTKWQGYWKLLRDNDVLIAPDWNTAYYTHFSGSSGKGPRPLVVSYSSSPAAEVIYSDPKVTVAPTANVTFAAFEQIEYSGILKGTQQETLAKAFIDFMLSDTFQNDIPLNMFVYPVTQTAVLPAEFVQFSAVPTVRAQLVPAMIAANREAWLVEWDTIMLK